MKKATHISGGALMLRFILAASDDDSLIAQDGLQESDMDGSFLTQVKEDHRYIYILGQGREKGRQCWALRLRCSWILQDPSRVAPCRNWNFQS